MASHLRITVTKNGVTKVALTMPASAVEDLNNLIEPDITERIEQRGVKIDEIVRNVRHSGFAPAELFALEMEDNKEIRVWIE
jgi:hypothetical protein